MQAECDLTKVVPMNTCKDGARDYVTTQKRIVIWTIWGSLLSHPEKRTRRKAKTVRTTCWYVRLRHPENWTRRKTETATPVRSNSFDGGHPGQPPVPCLWSGSLWGWPEVHDVTTRRWVWSFDWLLSEGLTSEHCGVDPGKLIERTHCFILSALKLLVITK